MERIPAYVPLSTLESGQRIRVAGARPTWSALALGGEYKPWRAGDTQLRDALFQPQTAQWCHYDRKGNGQRYLGGAADMPDSFRGAQDRGPNVARRRLLVVAAGGVVVGIGTVVGRGGGRPVSAAEGGTARGASPSASPSATRTPGGAATRKAPPEPRPSTGQAGVDAAKAPAAAQPMYYLDDGPKVIALTIDDGPSPAYTPQVLQVLEEYGVLATFSMVGKNVSYYPAVAKDVAQAGHTIINHTWDHANLTSLKATQQRAEITRATDAIHAATDVRPSMFRAPYGAWSQRVLEYCAAEKLTPLDWSVDPRDWARPGVSKIVAGIMKTTKTGSIILEHDGGGNRSQTVAALKIVIPRLLDEGYRFAIP
jgi:peptidoglycan/xylan/chitin deacetylase (PgdA/CDA1 family)